MSRPQDRAPRPLARTILRSPVHLLAFGLGAGLSPRAPGTVGTLWGIPVFLLLQSQPPLVYASAVALLFGAGVWICGESAKRLGLHDCPGIVFDELVGFLITAAPLLPAFALARGAQWPWLLAAFIAFRVFDILKPWPIRRLDREVHGGFGIMLDDAVAGLYGAALLLLATALT